MKKKILVAMSGGVDSSVAAAILKEAGHEVAGATIRTWASNTCADLNTRACCGLSGVEDARDVAAALGIPYWVFNFEKEFKEHVVDRFASEYFKGRTPNPCISCNEHVKFRLFYRRARQLGYDFIATGHYAQRAWDEKTGRYYLAQGQDASKDQSYVLFPLDQEILSRLFFPVGGFTKAEIRAKAAALNLGVAAKPDSQEICFIPSNDYGAFLEREYASRASHDPKGVIRTRDGRVVGEHHGFFHYTRGQRRGLGGGQAEKFYVVDTIPETNEVIVGTKDEVLGLSCVVGRVNWFLDPFSKGPFPLHSSLRANAVSEAAAAVIDKKGDGFVAKSAPRNDTRNGNAPFKCFVKIRSQHPKAPASLTLAPDGRVQVEFDEPQDAITPGQAAVFYDGPKVLGGGWIDEAG